MQLKLDMTSKIGGSWKNSYIKTSQVLSNPFNLFSFLPSKLVDHHLICETDTDVSFPGPITDAECKN